MNFFKSQKKGYNEYCGYIKNNKESVTERNQKVLVTMSMLYTGVLFFYTLIVPIYFADWNVTGIYQSFLLVQVLAMLYVIFRFGKRLRSAVEGNVSCLVFQIYIMIFVITVSIMPVEKDQPAMYFAPIAAALSIIFTYPLVGIILANLLEIIVLDVLSFLLKTKEVFYVNFFASILIFLIIIYITYVIYGSRIREYKIRQRIEKMSEMDMLTSIYNRAATELICQEYIRRHAEDGFAVAMIDLDNFKQVNDTLGHPVGDKLLKDVAVILKEAAGSQNIVGRIGGDEFLIFFKRGNDRDTIEAALKQILQKIRIIEFPGSRVKVTASIGVCLVNKGEHLNYETLFSRADQSLYKIKWTTKDNYSFYQEERHE